MRERECQAEIHVDSCPCQRCRAFQCGGCKRTNVDHFTSKGIAKLLGWSKAQIERESNKQFLSYECHSAKDKHVPEEMAILRRQKQGKFIPIGGHADLGYDGK